MQWKALAAVKDVAQQERLKSACKAAMKPTPTATVAFPEDLRQQSQLPNQPVIKPYNRLIRPATDYAGEMGLKSEPIENCS